MAGKKIFNTQDLVLKVNDKNFDPIKYPLDEWERFWGGDNPVVNGFPDRSLTHDSALAAHKKQFGE